MTAKVKASVRGMLNRLSERTQKKCQFPINPGAVGMVIPIIRIIIRTKAATGGRWKPKAKKRM